MLIVRSLLVDAMSFAVEEEEEGVAAAGGRVDAQAGRSGRAEEGVASESQGTSASVEWERDQRLVVVVVIVTS